MCGFMRAALYYDEDRRNFPEEGRSRPGPLKKGYDKMDHVLEPNILEFFFAYGVLLGVCLLWRKYMHKDLTFNRGIFLSLLVGYLLMIVLISLQPMTAADRAFVRESGSLVNINPFKELGSLLQGTQGHWQIMWNLILPVPLMFFIGFARKGRVSLFKLVFIGFIASCLVEGIQYSLNDISFFPKHIFETEDIMMNTFGSMIGSLAFCLMEKQEWMKSCISDTMS
ncbi:VanZ family protein [Sporolactobacillus sp. THM7-7]|nr:VanZ family protein [Sporolactobacillus sp. THM7-7]